MSMPIYGVHRRPVSLCHIKGCYFLVYFLIPFIRVLYPFLSSFFPRRFAVPFPSIQPARKSTTMKFSLAAASAVLLTTFASLARADEYADAIKEWCQGAYPLLLIRFDLNRKLTFFFLSLLPTRSRCHQSRQQHCRCCWSADPSDSQ